MLSDVLRLSVAGFTMGWGPCLAYTAPILLPYIGATKKKWKNGLKAALLFSAGRLLAFSLLGGMATVAFRSINLLFPPPTSVWLYLAVAVFVAGMGVLVILGRGFRIHIGDKLLDKSTHSMVGFGFLIGIAPCAPYIAILTYIACAAENNVPVGVAYAAAFSAGAAVAPVVLGSLAGLVSEKIYGSAFLRRALQIICGAVLIVFGARLIYAVIRQQF